jgi:hypothetical protein
MFAGRLSEAIERLMGRESTEVKVKFKAQWPSEADKASVDDQFAGLYRRMQERSVNECAAVEAAPIGEVLVERQASAAPVPR